MMALPPQQERNTERQDDEERLDLLKPVRWQDRHPDYIDCQHEDDAARRERMELRIE